MTQRFAEEAEASGTFCPTRRGISLCCEGFIVKTWGKLRKVWYTGDQSGLLCQVMKYLLPAVVVLVPLLIAPGLTLHYDVIPRLAAFELLLAGMLLCWPAWIPGVRRLARPGYGRGMLGLSAAAAIWIVSCAATSTDRNLSVYGSVWRALGALTWVSLIAFAVVAAGALVEAPGLTRPVLRAAAASGIIGAVYGILQYFGFDPFLPASAYHAGEGVFRIVRSPGTLGQADYFALWLVSVFFLAFALARTETDRWRWVGYTSQTLAAIAIVLSGTRAALAGLAAGAIVVAMLIRPRIAPRRLAAAALPVAAAIAFIVSPAGAALRARVHWSLDEPAGGARLLLWRDSLRMIAARPVQGFGPESYSSEFPRFASMALARAYPDWYHESPHNALLDAGTSTGLPGVALALALAGLGLAAAWSAIRVSPGIGGAVFGGLLAQFVSLQFASLTVSGAVFLALFAALAVSTAPARLEERTPWPRWMAIPATAAAILFAVYAVRLLGADVLLERFDQALSQQRTATAMSWYQRAERWSPSGAASDLYCSRRLLSESIRTPRLQDRLEIWHYAAVAGGNAVRYSEDRQNAWYNLAIISATEGDSRNVERCLREAAAVSPRWFKPHWMLSRLLRMEGRIAEAQAEAAVALALDAGHDPEVGQSLAQTAALAPR